MVDKKYLAIAELIGTIIGAGFLAIPFVMMKSGAPIGLFHLVVIGILVCIIMLYLGEIALRTKRPHQLAGYASKYLGKTGKKIMFIALLFEVYSAVLAYLIAEGISISHLFFGNSDYAFIISIIFWIILSAFIFKGIKALKNGEFFGNLILLLIVALITIIFIPQIQISNLTTINFANMFVPFGVILFAYLAFTSITETVIILGKEKQKLKSSIIQSFIISFLVYAIFAIVVLGVKGQLTPEIATLSLGKPFIILGILTMLTSYLALSVSLCDSFKFDYNMHKIKAWLTTIIVPLFIFILLVFLNKTSFVTILGIGGVISGGLLVILILIMHTKAQKLGERKPEYSMPNSIVLKIIIALIFIIGASIELWYAIT